MDARAISEIQTGTGDIGYDANPAGGADMDEVNATANSEPQKLAEPLEVAEPQEAAEPQEVAEPQPVAEPQEVAEPQQVAEPQAPSAEPEENSSP
jgi:hypothetical protein